SVRDHLGAAAGRRDRCGRPGQEEDLNAAWSIPDSLRDPVRDRCSRRADASQRDRGVHVRRADAQCGQPVVRGPGPGPRRGGPADGVLRDDGGGRRGCGGTGHHPGDLPAHPVGGSELDQPPQGLSSVASWAWLTIALPLLGGLINGGLALTRSTNKRLVSLVGPGVMIAAFAVAVGAFLDLHATGQPTRILLWSWMPVSENLNIEMALLIDQLSVVMLLVVTGVGSLIHLFSVGYMHADPGYARYFSYLNFFVAGMLILVLGSSLPVTFIGWEAVGLCSYLL